MSNDQQSIQSVLALYTEEHYAHARDHEHLRAQITAILTAASLVVIGLAIGSNASQNLRVLSGFVAIILSVQNVWLVLLHNNRFNMHVSIARKARLRMTKAALGEDWSDDSKAPSQDPCKIQPKAGKEKIGNLGVSWMSVPLVPFLAGLYLVFGNFK